MARERTRERKRHEGSASVSSEHKSGRDTVSEKSDVKKIPIDDLQDVPNPARVRVLGSVTKNLGNYESVRVGVEIEMPCLPNTEAIDATYKNLSQHVDEKIQEEMALATGEEYEE